MLPHLVRLIAVAAVLAPATASQASPARVVGQPVAEFACDGGIFVAATFTGSDDRLLTAGEEGDLILWNVRTGQPMRRYPPLGRDVNLIRPHPRDPWALVVVRNDKESSIHVLFLDSGRTRRLLQRQVEDIAFDSDGLRVAFLFTDGPAPELELEVHSDAATLAAHFDSPEQRHAAPTQGRVLFAPNGEVVLTRHGGASSSCFRAGDDEPRHVRPGILAFGPDDEPVRAGGRVRFPNQACGPWSAWRSNGRLHRAGPVTSDWPLSEDAIGYEHPTVGRTGIVAIADRLGSLRVFGPEPGATKELVGHLGKPLQLTFNADGSALAVVGRCSTTLLSCTDGTARRIPGRCSVQPDGDSGFLLLREDGVYRCDKTGREAGTAVHTWPATRSARHLVRDWNERISPMPWLCQRPVRGAPLRPASLWLGNLAQCGDGRGLQRATLLLGARSAPLDLPTDPRDVSPNLAVSAIVEARSARVLVAQRSPPTWCGTGLQGVVRWGALRQFDRAGKLRRSRYTKRGIETLRVSPNGRYAVQLPTGIVVDTSSLETVGRAQNMMGWSDFAFCNNRTGIATNGRYWMRVSIPSLATRVLADIPGVHRIDLLTVPPRGGLLAVASGGRVVVFRTASG